MINVQNGTNCLKLMNKHDQCAERDELFKAHE